MRFDNFELIYSYTRKQALAGRVLIEISQEAKKTASKYTPQSRLIIFTFISHLLLAWKERDNQPVADFMMYWKCSKLRHLCRWDGSHVFFDVMLLKHPRTIEKVNCSEW